jgi:hypothetical protein
MPPFMKWSARKSTASAPAARRVKSSCATLTE